VWEGDGEVNLHHRVEASLCMGNAKPSPLPPDMCSIPLFPEAAGENPERANDMLEAKDRGRSSGGGVVYRPSLG